MSDSKDMQIENLKRQAAANWELYQLSKNAHDEAEQQILRLFHMLSERSNRSGDAL